MGVEFPAMATAYSTEAVLAGRRPILLVAHESNGDWQFLDGGVANAADGVAVHLGHIVEAHPALRALADLPRGWAAERSSAADEWKRYQLAADSA
jgi:hypothetical protein